MKKFRALFFAVFLFSCNQKKEQNVNTEIKDSVSLLKTSIDSLTVFSDETEVKENINFSSQKLERWKQPVKLSSGDSFSLIIPKNFKVSVAFETKSRIRFLAMSPDKRLFVTDMKNLTDNRKGELLVFEGWNEAEKKFNKKSVYLSNLHNPNQAAFYKGYLYVAETDKLTRYPYIAGSATVSSAPEILATFPDYGLGYKYGGWHLTRSLAFKNNKIYVSVGSSCNACVEREEVRASITQMNLDGTDPVIYARGLRNSVGIDYIGNELWTTGMGRDWIGDDRPDDLFQKIDSAGYYGWPYYYQVKNEIFEDAQFKDSARPAFVTKPPQAYMALIAHSAPLGFEYLKNFNDTQLKNSVLICLHGPVVIKKPLGYSIIKAGANNVYVEVVSGFLTGKTAADKHGRPCDVLMKDENSFFFTDDYKGVLYYVNKEK